MLRSHDPYSDFRMFSHQPVTLRMRLMGSYPKRIVNPIFEPKEISKEQFVASMNQWLQYANKPYSQREDHGIYYAEDYVEKHGNSEDLGSIHGLTHPTYWDVSARGSLFKAKEGYMPNQALNAFFEGPTFAECGTVMQACIYRAIEEMIGTKEFNRIFGSSLSQFLITGILFDKIKSSKELKHVHTDDKMAAGNPLFFLFDKMENPTEKDINIGDILYVQGVDKYQYKHLSGSGTGWNLICSGKNSNGENLYLGFGPGSFPEALTYKEIKSLLIKYYNEDQLVDTQKTIQRIESSPGMMQNMEAVTRGRMAKAFANDTVNEEYPIVGLKYAIRFNQQKLENFVKQGLNTWHTLSEAQLAEKCPLKQNSLNNPVKQITTFSVETRGKSFADFKATNPTQMAMLSNAKKFALSVCSERDAFVGFVMTGMPGIGKTHLGVAVADFAAQQGKKVLFVDEKTISNLYQKMSEERSGAVPLSEMESLFQEWLKDIDLIIVDDINSEFGIGANFLQSAIRYAIKNEKAIMIGGNQPLLSLQKNLEDYIGYDDERRNNFLIIQDLQGISYRKSWWNESDNFSSSGKLQNNQDAMEILINHKTSQSAGIIIEEKEINLEKVARQYLALSPDKTTKIRILQEPYKQTVFDFYVHDVAQHDVFILKWDNTFGQTGQLLDLVSRVHDLGKKIIVVTNNKETLQQKINEELESFLKKDTRQRLKDRTQNLLLKESDWDNVAVKQCVQSVSDQRSADPIPNITIGPQTQVMKPSEKLNFSPRLYDMLMLDEPRSRSTPTDKGSVTQSSHDIEARLKDLKDLLESFKDRSHKIIVSKIRPSGGFEEDNSRRPEILVSWKR